MPENFPKDTGFSPDMIGITLLANMALPRRRSLRSAGLIVG
jgi:hypothetical protein